MINERFTNPFPGLRPFESTEDHLFFGRDGQSDELLRRLRRSRFLAVLGTSGSGKSSLVRAGMLPSLFGGLMTQAGSDWRVALFRPGHDPIGNLAAALASEQVLGRDGDDAALQKTIIEATLRRSALGLVETTRQARMPANENLLVVVDQFEEIFRFRRMSKREGPEDEAAAFIKLLLEAKRQMDVPVYIVITMRSDFLGDCAQFRDLPEAINDGQYLIPRMTRDQRREAITGPVAVGGGEIAARLVNRLLNDVGDNPDHLPILQHALMRTWELWAHDRRNGEPIDLRHYEGVGTMADALSRHADEAYAELPNEGSRELAKRIFKSLTEKGPDNREIRRPTKVSEIAAIAEAEPAEVIAVIEPFRQPGRSFLMPPASVTLTADSLIDISHESLIRGWERLRKWVDEEARSANIYRRIADTAILHREDRAGLWHDPDLALALRWREENRPNLVWGLHYHPEFDLAMNFIDASKTTNEAEIAARDAARKKEVRRTRIFATIFAGLFLIAAGFGVFAVQARNTAYAARNEAVEEKKRADAARGEAVKEKNNAQQSEQRAVASEKTAQREKGRAEDAAKIAEDQRTIADQQRKQAEAATVQAREAQAAAETERREANRQALETLYQSVMGGRQALNDKSSINTLSERLINVTPPREAAYWRNTYATALAEIGRPDLSKNESTKVLEVFNDNLNALTNRGYMSLIRFETKQALEDFERARAIDPQYALNYLNLAVAQANLNKYDEAAKSIKQAIEWYRPGYFDGVFDSEVSEDIKKATHQRVIYAEGYDFNTALYYERASIEAFRGGSGFEKLLGEADREAESSGSSNQGYLTALNWAWLQYRSDQQKDYGALAIEAYLWRKADYPDWAQYYYQKFQCEHRSHNDQRYATIADWVRRQLRTFPQRQGEFNCDQPPELGGDARSTRALKELKDANVLKRMSLLQAQELTSIGQYRQADALLTPEVEKFPDDVDLLLARARARERARYWAHYWKEEEDAKRFNDGAREDFRKLLTLVETQTAYKPIVYLWAGFLGDSLAFTPAEKTSFFEQSSKLGPANGGALMELAKNIAPTEPTKAIDYAKRSIALDPSADGYYNLAAIQDNAGDHQAALQSIQMAIAMQDDNVEYFEMRRRIESELGVDNVVSTRHLAEDYFALGNNYARQGRYVEAYQNYQKSSDLLSGVSAGDKSGEVSAELLLLKEKIVDVLEASHEKVSSRIVDLKSGEGKTRQVTIDRGSDDGLKAGDDGTLWTVYSKTGDKVRKVQKIGTSHVNSVSADSAVVTVTMDNPNDDTLVQVGDMVEVDARVPPLANRSILWKLSRYHISFTSEDGERIFADYRKLYRDEDPELVNKILTQMTTEISRSALRISDAEIMKTVIKSGRFQGKTLKEVVDNPTREDLLAMMDEMWQYPATYYGKDLKIFRTFGAWVLDEPK
jgi:tetratricopeptide (TPR) repeat protein